jgi:hypothetical protein
LPVTRQQTSYHTMLIRGFLLVFNLAWKSCVELDVVPNWLENAYTIWRSIELSEEIS